MGIPARAGAAGEPEHRDLASPPGAEPELADQAVLQRLPEALDAALRLPIAGGDIADAQLL